MPAAAVVPDRSSHLFHPREQTMPKKNDGITLRITRRQLATILAALRFHQDENLQGGRRSRAPS